MYLWENKRKTHAVLCLTKHASVWISEYNMKHWSHSSVFPRLWWTIGIQTTCKYEIMHFRAYRNSQQCATYKSSLSYSRRRSHTMCSKSIQCQCDNSYNIFSSFFLFVLCFFICAMNVLFLSLCLQLLLRLLFLLVLRFVVYFLCVFFFSSLISFFSFSFSIV